MKRFKILFLFIGVTLLSGCITEWDKMLDTDTLDSEVISISENITEKDFDVKIKEYHKNLIVEMDIDLPKDFPYPVAENGSGHLTRCSFFIVFYFNGEPLKTKAKTRKSKGYIKDTTDLLAFATYERNMLREDLEYELEIPILLFHNVPSGEQELEVVIFQRSFSNSSDYNYGTSEYDEKETKKVTLIKQRLKFIMDMPEVNETVIYTNGLILQNDEEFSPSGMDFSFRQGYPDIYWTIYYPAKSESDFNYQYFSSDIQHYATEYSIMDTIYFYHYEDLNNFKIGVYDHDNLNRDDFLGDWYGSFKDLIPENEDYITLSFDHVDSFLIKAQENGVAN